MQKGNDTFLPDFFSSGPLACPVWVPWQALVRPPRTRCSWRVRLLGPSGVPWRTVSATGDPPASPFSTATLVTFRSPRIAGVAGVLVTSLKYGNDSLRTTNLGNLRCGFEFAGRMKPKRLGSGPLNHRYRYPTWCRFIWLWSAARVPNLGNAGRSRWGWKMEGQSLWVGHLRRPTIGLCLPSEHLWCFAAEFCSSSGHLQSPKLNSAFTRPLAVVYL